MALGWSMLLANHLREGRLIRLGQRSHQTADHYCLLVGTARENRDAVEAFTGWMARDLTQASG